MEVRTYHANTVEAAFALAKREFGAEAMLMQSNRIVADHRGEYEVVFAGEPLDAPPDWSNAQPSVKLFSSPPLIVRPAKASTAEMAFGPVDLVRARPLPVPAVAPGPNFKRHNTRPPNARTEVPKLPPDKPFRDVVCNPGLARFASSSYTIALAGPTGSGKTTTAMKLAVRYGLLASHPCRLVAYDPDRVGAAERLRHFANLLKIPFEKTETHAQLSDAINRQTEGLTIIDTPGCARADDHILAGLTFLLGSHPEVEIQLVLRADRKVSDNFGAAARFSPLGPKRLIMTNLDETSDYRELGALALRTALPLSFLGTGQRVPEDLEPAGIPRLEELVKYGWSKRAAAAA